MDEHEDIEQKLKEFREGRDQEMPADRRLLPVHKDRLLAEARRRYSDRSAPGWIARFRPAVRWAMVAAPVLILALAGYFWLQNQDLKRQRLAAENDRVALLDGSEPLGAPRKHEERTRSLRKEDMDTVSDLAQAPAEIAAGERSFDSAKTLPATPAPKSSAYAINGASAVGGEMAQNEPAQMAMLNLSGQYRVQAPARDQLQSEGKVARSATPAEDKMAAKDEKSADAEGFVGETRRAKEAGAPVSNFSNFKLTQNADRVTLVDADGSVYVGRMTQTQQPALKQNVMLKSKAPARQDVSNLVQQANLVGTNRLTREVVNLVANFYVEPSGGKMMGDDRESVAASSIPEESGEVSKSEESMPQKKRFAEKQGTAESPKPGVAGAKPAAIERLQSNIQNRVQNTQAPVRVSVVIERMDLKNNRQETISNAEKISE